MSELRYNRIDQVWVVLGNQPDDVLLLFLPVIRSDLPEEWQQWHGSINAEKGMWMSAEADVLSVEWAFCCWSVMTTPYETDSWFSHLPIDVWVEIMVLLPFAECTAQLMRWNSCWPTFCLGYAYCFSRGVNWSLCFRRTGKNMMNIFCLYTNMSITSRPPSPSFA